MRYLTGNDLPCESNDKQTAVSVAAQVIKQVKQKIYSIHFLLSLTFLPCPSWTFEVWNISTHTQGGDRFSVIFGVVRYSMVIE